MGFPIDLFFWRCVQFWPYNEAEITRILFSVQYCADIDHWEEVLKPLQMRWTEEAGLGKQLRPQFLSNGRRNHEVFKIVPMSIDDLPVMYVSQDDDKLSFGLGVKILKN